MPLACQSSIIPDNILLPEALSVEDRIEAVVKISLFAALVLQQRSIHRLGFLIDHLDNLGYLFVLLLPGKVEHTPSALNLNHFICVKLKRFNHGIDIAVF